MELDDALKSLGDFGRYQTIVYVLICLVGQLTQSWHMLAIGFLGAVPEHHCQIPPVGGPADDVGDPWNHYYPLEPGKVDGEDPVNSSCSRYVNFTAGNATEGCTDGWIYDEELYGKTIATEWNLVCDEKGKVDLSMSIFMGGVMVGSLVFGQLSDRYGRKPIWFISIWAQIAFGVAVAFSPNYWTFVALRFFVGVFEQGIDLTSYVMVTEMFTPSKRGPAGILLTVFWASGIMSLPGLAYLLKDWVYLQLAISLPNILTVFIIAAIPESTRWLLSRGKIDQAEANLQRIAKFNGKEIPSPILSQAHQANTSTNYDIWTLSRRTKVNAKLRQVSAASDPDLYDLTNGDTKTLTLVEGYSIASMDALSESDAVFGAEKHFTLLDLIRTRNMRKLTIIMAFVWFVNSVIYYGLSLNTDSLAGDPYLNFFISGAVEVPAYFVAAGLIRCVGRRLPLCACHIIGGIACIATVFIPAETEGGTDLSPVIVTVAMAGKFCISASYAIVFLYASELFPTVIRNLGLGVSSFSSRVGGIVAPFLLALDVYEVWLPMTIFGTLSILAGFSVLPLPETLGRTQPQTIQDAEALHRRTRSKLASDKLPFSAHINLEDNDTKL
ncbi:organic cation transporter protein [Strongylocentrotus purpuratus]|uniref:Major facilitator superfamily (MFS) profile domain-containing protein n=1 Tax=Strongylocentrotus purpuratus TaxID=7668 RepID=A0A7M7N9A1_STRPU|nr:organic cation transporter protein [Strongylocentrotus purpuratus]